MKGHAEAQAENVMSMFLTYWEENYTNNLFSLAMTRKKMAHIRFDRSIKTFKWTGLECPGCSGFKEV